MQREAWGSSLAANEEPLRYRFKTNPSGILAVDVDGQPMGFVSTMRISSYDYDDPPSWEDLSSDGWCDDHRPHGKIVYCIDLSHTRTAPRGTMDLLMAGVCRHAIAIGAQYVLVGGRMPAYHEYAERYTPDEFIRARRSTGRFVDPEVEIYSRVPGLKAIRVIPNYLADPDSLDYGVLLRWRNPFYRLPGRAVWAKSFRRLSQIEQEHDRWRVTRSRAKERTAKQPDVAEDRPLASSGGDRDRDPL